MNNVARAAGIGGVSHSGHIVGPSVKEWESLIVRSAPGMFCCAPELPFPVQREVPFGREAGIRGTTRSGPQS